MEETGRPAVDPAIKNQEANDLSRIWKAAPKSKRGTQEEFGEKWGIGSQSAVGQYLRGDIPLNFKAAMAFASGLECQISDFSPRLAGEIEGLARHAVEASTDDEFADVRRLDVKVAAGHGSVPYLEEELGALKFRRDFLRSIGVSEGNAVVVTVTGASMEPTIAHGAVLLVNRANREPRANALYVFHLQGNGLVVKRVVKSGGQWLARSDNDDREAFPDFAFDEGATLIGRAVWMGAKL